MDSSQALYRRYRPESFAEMIGQEHITEPLRAALAANRANHAYLFSGPRGCGKTTSARILARTLNCEEAPVADPCGECRSCRDLARGGPGSIDVIEIDAASHGGVDDARDLRERAFFAPVASRFKVYIIDEAHMVTTQGFNALLKLVEEPPAHLKFIFATTEPEKVIATIRSRTHHYPFRLIAPRVLSEYLASLCEHEGVRIDQAALPLVVRAGAGSVRDSLSVLDQLIGGAGSGGVTYEVAATLLGYTPENLLDDVVDAFAAGDGGAAFNVVEKVIGSGQDPRRFTEDLLRRLRDLVIVAAVPDAPASGLIDAPEDQAERLVAQSARFGRAELVRAADVVASGLTEMRGTTTPRLLLELVCARLLLPAADDDRLSLAARIDRLERRASMTGSTPVSPESEASGSSPAADSRPRAASSQPATAPTSPVGDAVAPGRSAGSAGATGAGTPTGAPTSAGPGTGPVPDAATKAEAEEADSATSAVAPGRFALSDVRRMWPDVLDRVKGLRRFTWILLSQNAQVIGVDESTLTLGFRSAGARESFLASASEEIVRQAAIDAIGADWRVESVTDPGASPSGQSPPASSGRSPRRGPPADAPDPSAGGPTGTPAQAGASHPQSDRDAAAHPDDPDLDEAGLDPAVLLERELGATVIDEITHD